MDVAFVHTMCIQYSIAQYLFASAIKAVSRVASLRVRVRSPYRISMTRLREGKRRSASLGAQEQKKEKEVGIWAHDSLGPGRED